jgi:hypothetical protein
MNALVSSPRSTRGLVLTDSPNCFGIQLGRAAIGSISLWNGSLGNAPVARVARTLARAIHFACNSGLASEIAQTRTKTWNEQSAHQCHPGADMGTAFDGKDRK